MIWRLERGANPMADGSVEFSIWAPLAKRVAIELCPSRRTIALERGEAGEWRGSAPGIAPGTDYFVVLDEDRRRPDPVSRHQPHGVHGASRIVEPASFAWTDAGWRGVPLSGLVIEEIHIGTFTPEGTFDAAIGRLEHLVDLGITAVEIMPVAEFPGARNWGYDGVALYAPHSAYGGPAGFARLVDACHARGLAVVLDVVYNHLGPEGNYLAEFGPYFSERYHTPWGSPLNFDDAESDEVRRYFVDNALHWLTEYHVDGLRLDAVHAIFDFSAEHVLAEIGRRFHEQARALGRRAWLIAESDLNDTRVTRPRREGGWELDAQWSDDFHHALFTVVTGASHGYFVDYGSIADLDKAIREGFVYDGERSRFRRRRHGMSSADRPGIELVVFSQNHDQIANASHGQRLSSLVSPALERVSAMILMSAPNLPMLFQGQEWGERAPFHYFTSHTDEGLSKAVFEGRKREFAEFGALDVFRDPRLEATFLDCKLNWDAVGMPEHAALLSLHRDSIALRKRCAALSNHRKDLTRTVFDPTERWIAVRRGDDSGAEALLLVNFDAQPKTLPAICEVRLERALWSHAPDYWTKAPDAEAPPDAISPGSEVVLSPQSAVIYATTRP